MALQPDSRTLYTVWTGWIAGGLMSLVLALYGLRSLPWSAARGIPVDWKWMRGGVRVALPFLGATLAFQGVQYADRYFLQHYRGEAAVGVYTFFAGIANIVHVFVFSGVNQILYPRLIEAFQEGSMDRYRGIYRKLATGIVAGTVLLSAAAAVLVYPLLTLIGKSEYIEHHRIFYIMLITVSLLTVSYLPHYSLYVRRADRRLVLATVMSFVVAVTANWLLVPHYGLAGAAFATAAAMATLLAGKLTGIYAVRTTMSGQRGASDE